MGQVFKLSMPTRSGTLLLTTPHLPKPPQIMPSMRTKHLNPQGGHLIQITPPLLPYLANSLEHFVGVCQL